MKCTQIKERFSDYLTGDIDAVTREQIQEHMTACSPCREELESLSALWTKLGVIPEEQPSENVRARFYTLLQTYKESPKQEKSRSFLRRLLPRWSGLWMPVRPAYQFVPALLFIAVGLVAGYFLSAHLQRGVEIAQIQQEVSHIRQMAESSLVRQEFVSAVLVAAGLDMPMKQAEQRIQEALLTPFAGDVSGVSQTDSAVPSSFFQDYLLFREELAKSISDQASPLMDIALVISRNLGRL